MKRLRSLLLICGLCLAAMTQFAPAGLPQANVQGQWKTLPYTMPINPIHVALLRNGKVIVTTGSGNLPSNLNFQAALWDPQAGTITTQTVGFDMFCNGMTVLPDGRVFIAGGTLKYDPFLGASNSSLYDPSTNTFTDQQSMAHGRWYPTTTLMGDGRVFVFSGLDETSSTNMTVEIYTPGSGWGPAMAAPWLPPLYPRMHLLPNGTLFYSGSTPSSWIFNPSNNSWSSANATTNYGGIRTYGSSVLFPLTPANGYKPTVMIFGGGTTTTPATATTEIIDLSAANPHWVYGPSMSAPRIEMDATLLPNGKILALGGSTNDEDATTASLNADLYDPNTNSFSPAGTEAFARLYHTVSLLMPDATVWVAGGNPFRGNYERHMEIYSPAYLFNPDGSLATRPSITNVTSKIGYGSAFQVQTPDAANISTVVLMRNGSSTHAFDMDQRYVGVSFTAGSGVLNVTGPPNSNVAPAGYYMLFILNKSGVPSVAGMVQLSGAPGDLPPTGTITSPASNVTITAGQSVTYSGTGSDPDGTISAYSWSFPGGSPSSSNLANPGAITYSTPGTYVTTFTVTDNAGLIDPNPPTRTITVQSAGGGGGGGIDFGSGFSTTGLQFNGSAALNGTRLQVTNTTTSGQAGSAFWTQKVNVATFTNDFVFQLTNPVADGMTFTIQGVGPTALGEQGGELGYGGFGKITSSIAVKFDLYSNAGEGPNSTGLYTNGADPTVPAITLGGGVDLHSGHVFKAHMTYDGTTLTMTITDQTTPANTFTTSWPINIPATVGGSTAYVGFTGGTGGGTATQEILNWTYSAGTTTVTPDFSVSVSPSSQTVTPGNSTTYTVTIGALNGFTGTVNLSASGLPTGASASFAPATITASGSSTMTVTTGSTTPTGTSTLTVTGTSGNLTHSATTAINVQSSSGGGGINFGSGFSTTGLQFNGSATLNGTRLQITNTTTTGQAGSAFWTQKVNVGTFTNDFVFQLTNPVADGMTFTIQGVGPTALGEQGGELGYGGFGKITPSVAVKFDLYSNAGEGPNSTGLYTNGADPTIPATTLGGGVDLHSGHIFKAHMTYDGTTLTMTITDQTTPANTFTTSWPINIPATVGGSTAYVGFTGGTGGGTATQEILNWTYK